MAIKAVPVNLKNTRESWLIEAMEDLRAGLFNDNGAAVPSVRVSVGFPGGGSARNWKGLGLLPGQLPPLVRARM